MGAKLMTATAVAERSRTVSVTNETHSDVLWREPGSTAQAFTTPLTSAGLRDLIPGITTTTGRPSRLWSADIVSMFPSPRSRVPVVDGANVSGSPTADLLTQHVLTSLFGWLERHSSSNAFVLAHTAAMFIRRLLDADGPTPQIRSNGADGIEVEWLVNGVSLTIDVASESEILIYAVDNAERELFSKEITSRWSTSDEIFDKAAALLKDMARNIDVPAPLQS